MMSGKQVFRVVVDCMGLGFMKGFFVGCLFVYFYFHIFCSFSIESSGFSSKYKANAAAWRTAETVDRKVVFEHNRLRLESHQVRIEDEVFDDWLFVDLPEQINVLAEHEGMFYMFNQTKYGLLGYSLATVGGYIEPGETSRAAAIRELKEELAMAPGRLHDLGKFRVDVNRGCGFVTLFLASDCKTTNAILSDDLEKQKVVRLTIEQVQLALEQKAVHEVKWAATAALAIEKIRFSKRVQQTMSLQFKRHTSRRILAP